MIYVLSGGGSGATLIVTPSADGNVTVSNSTLGKSFTKAATAGNPVEFKGLASGTWTVTLSDGTSTASKTVIITADYSTSIQFFTATITVTYPADSVCVIKDADGVTVATDTNSTAAAKTVDLTVGAVGEYTVIATSSDGNKSKNASVEITAEGQIAAVTLAYQMVLYDAGNTCDEVTGGWNKTSFSYGNISFGASYITMIPGYYSDSSEPLAIATKNSFSSDNYKYLYIDYEQTLSTAYFGATANTSGDPNALTYSAKQTLTPTERTTTHIDTSTSGNFYVAAATTFAGQGGHGKYLRIHKIWLE